MAVGFSIIRVPRRGTRTYSGEFAVAGGAITAGTTRFKNEVSVVRQGLGIYRFQCLENGTAARPASACRISSIKPTFTTPPGGATEGGWAWNMNNDQMNASGFFDLRINQQSWAAADPVQTVKVEFTIEAEAA